MAEPPCGDAELGDRLTRTPAQLSGGQQRRGCRDACAGDPAGNLEFKAGAALLAFLRSCVTHLGQSIDPVAASCADRVVFLANGRVGRDGGADHRLRLDLIKAPVGSTRSAPQGCRVDQWRQAQQLEIELDEPTFCTASLEDAFLEPPR